MKIELFKKIKILIIISTLIGAVFISNVVAVSDPQQNINNQDTQNTGNKGTEYWALLVAVGVYADNPQQDRPLMLEEVDDLYETLLQSELWSEDHIKVIKGEDATCSNIISGLKWLDSVEDEDDFSLVFLTSHGAFAGVDLFPWDEADGTDEFLISYWGFAYPGLDIWDDQLNFWLNQLDSQGVCLIVDSCYAGGFNDPPNWIKTWVNTNQMSADEWIGEFGEELSGQKRVVLMASEEDQLSYSGGFAPYLIDGMRGFADFDEDDIVTAEEIFSYSEPRTSRQNPTMYDGYPGELPLIYLNGAKSNSGLEQQNKIEITTNLNVGLTPENSIVNGFVKDVNTNNPLEDALIYVRGRADDDEFFENETNTDSSGYYSVNIPSGRCRVTVYAEGYLSDSSGYLEVDENEILWINFSLYPRPPENSIVCGYIKDDETGDPIVGANISLDWDGGQEQFYMNETNSDINGFYSMNVAAGEIELEVRANGYFRETLDHIIILDFEIFWANFSLNPTPLENSTICGYVKDMKTGSPINNARLTFEWNDMETGSSYENETDTDSDGFYIINIAFGEIYHDIHKSGYEYYNPYRVDVSEDKIAWFNVTLEEETIEVEIVKPLRAFYINNERLFPYSKVRIIGSIDIEADVHEDWWGSTTVDKVEFYIDGDLKATVTSEPYMWTWSEIKFGKHTIKVIAYGEEGDSDSKEIEVYKFL